MKIERKLAHLEAAALWTINRAFRPYTQIKNEHNHSKRELLISPLVINTLNSWSLFIRTYFISCSLGARSNNGIHVTSSINIPKQTSIDNVIGLAVTLFKKNAQPSSSGHWDTRDEPKWHDSNTIIKAASHYKFSNTNDINTAFSFGFTAHKNLVVFRNYYAHRNRGTKQKAQNIAAQYGIRTNQHPTEILLDYPLTSPSVSLLETWRGEFEQTISLLCS